MRTFVAVLAGIVLAIIFAPLAEAGTSTIQIHSAKGPLTVDGSVNEAIWKQAAIFPMQATDYGTAFPQGGETLAVVRGKYLCLGARLPEPDRVVARSTGQNPEWWREDMIVWTIRFHEYGDTLQIKVNPLGAYSVKGSPLPGPWRASPMSAPVYGPGELDRFNTENRRDGPKLAEPVLVSAAIGKGEWSAEIAIPISDISNVGFIMAERIRVARPDAPELRWYWPGPSPGLAFHLPAGDPSVGPLSLIRKDWTTSVAKRIWTLPLQGTAATRESAGPIAADLASLPPDVWSASETGTFEADRMWEKNVRARVRDEALAEGREWEKVHSLSDWEKFRDPRIAALKASLGPFPSRTPLQVSVTRKVDYGEGFVIEDLIYESRPGLVVTANLYLPSKIEGRIPAIIVVPSQHAPKSEMELQNFGMTSARAGIAVLIADPVGSGERIQTQPWAGHHEGYYSRYAMGEQLYLAGESLMKWMVWDIDRSVDLLVKQPYIDRKRIVLLGAVAGGGDPAAVTAALDDRIAAVIPFNFGGSSPEDHYTSAAGPYPYGSKAANPGWGDWESTRSLRDSISGQFFPWLINASVAPRGFIFSLEMGWPHGIENEPIWQRYKKVFAFYGGPDRVAEIDGFGPFPGPGEVENVGAQHRVKLYPILHRWFDMPVPQIEYDHPRPQSDLLALTPQAAAERKPQTVSALALKIAHSRLAKARASRAPLSASEQIQSLRAALKKKLGNIDPAPDTHAQVVWTKQESGFSVDAITLNTAPGITVPLFLMKPENVSGNASGQRLPVVIAFAQGGKEAFLTERHADIAELLKHGVAVCLADVRGTGETARGVHSVVGPAALNSSSTLLSAMELMLGTTALGQRVQDARTVVHYLAARDDINPKRMMFWGASFVPANPGEGLLDQSVGQKPGPQVIRQSDPLGSLLVLLTALYEPNVRAVAAQGGLASYLSVLGSRFCYVPQDVIVPGILEVADVGDIVAALGPRPVLLEGFVDGRNRPLTDSEVQAQLRRGFPAAPSAAPELMIRQSSGPTGIASWLLNSERDDTR